MKKELPDGWEWKKLDDFADFLYGGAFESALFNEDGKGTKIIRIRNLKKGFTKTYYDGEYDESYLINNGDILIGMDGEFNIVKWRGDTVLLNQRICKLIVKSNELIPDFAYRVLIKTLKEIEDRTAFVTVKHLSAKKLKTIKIPVPPLETQHKIVAILEKAEETKKLRAQADELTQQFLQSLFIEMIGDPAINPKGWDTIKIADLVKSIEAGWSVNGEHRFKEKNEYGVLKVSAVTKGIFLPEEHKAIKPGTVLKKVVTPEKGDVLFSRANTLELVGATCLIRENYTELLLPDKIWKINLNKNLILPEVFKFILSTPSMRGEISKKSTGTSGSMYNISMAKLKLIHIPIPTLEIQYKFSKIYDLYESTQKQQEESRNNLDYLFNALMQKAFKGDLIH